MLPGQWTMEMEANEPERRRGPGVWGGERVTVRGGPDAREGSWREVRVAWFQLLQLAK